jgi:hypothetical protein
MPRHARSRPGTTPSFWCDYHNAQLKIDTFCMRPAASGVAREASIQELIADFDKGRHRLLTISSACHLLSADTA